MRASLFTGLTGLAAILAVVFGVQLWSAVLAPEPDPLAAGHTPISIPPGQSAAFLDQEHRAALAAAVLGRPLFSEGRRPAAVPSGSAASMGLPRLTGIVVDGASRSVIFATPGSDKPLVAREGAQIGPFTVQLIQADAVTVAGPRGIQILQPSFDPDRAVGQAPPPAPVAGGLAPGSLAPGPALLNLPSLPSLLTQQQPAPGVAAR